MLTIIPLLIIIVVLVALLLIVYLVDVNYFLRTWAILLYATFVQKSLGFLESSVLYARVLPFDADILITHMNNARVLRENDFGRTDFITRTGLLKCYFKEVYGRKSVYLYAASHVVRYRRPLYMFMKYKIVTRAVYWERKTVYFEQKIITVNDEIIRSISYCKMIFSFDVDKFVDKVHPRVVKPSMPEDVKLWVKFNEANCLNTRKMNVSNADLTTDEDD